MTMDYGHLSRPTWRKYTAKQVVQKCGLTGSLQLLLDAGDSASYASGQSWLDQSGNGYDFFLGETSSSEATDPTFNGTAGNLTSSEYFSVDGGDYFKYDQASIETWMNNLHKDGATFTICLFYQVPSHAASQWLFGTSDATTDVGVDCVINTSGSPIINVRTGSGNALAKGHPNGSTAGVWQFYGVSINEPAGGTASFVWSPSGGLSEFDGTYASPSSSNSTDNEFIIFGRPNGSSLPLSGARLAIFAAWSRALSQGEFFAFYNALRGRFGI